MRFSSSLIALVLVAGIAQGQQPAAPVLTELVPGMVITASTKIRPGTYRLTAPASLDSALITVRGDDVVLDMTDVILLGTDPEADPDRGQGVAIRVDSGLTVALRGGAVRGYKVAILATGTRGLEITGMDLSHNWKPRLFSVLEHESLADWLSFHHNEKDEWLRYGAAVYLRRVHGGEVRGSRIEHGMNGVMLTGCDSIRIWNNIIAFNSGIGIGLYRSSNNVIMHNHADYNVRGFSQGFYRRGQDSADLLMYEQSSRNVVAYNSMTHGGDGLFLWAGQQTMDTGEGGANDNLFYGNDFSFAPTNGMEATFSRNAFVDNRIEGSDHGLWGGYSYSSLILGNQFVANRIGIAIEHGQENSIVGNRFEDDSTAVSLWADSIEPSDWVYPKKRDTRSRGYRLDDNAIGHARVGLRIRNTSESEIARNLVTADSALVLSDTATIILLPRENAAQGVPRWVADSVRRWAPTPIPGALRPGSAVARRPRSSIIVDEWGPYDYRSPRLWPLDSTRSSPLRLQVLGPPGRWHLVSARGLTSVSDTAGAMPDTITVTPRDPSSGADWEVTLEFRGAQTTSPRGTWRPPGTPVRFSWGRFEPAMTWNARVYAWSDSTDPRSHPAAFTSLLTRAQPLTTLALPRLDWQWYRPKVTPIPLEKWALAASTEVDLAAGSYTLRTISDDGIRVWVDDQLVISRWDVHESAVDEVPLPSGHHRIRVEYFQLDGWMELRLEITRASQ